MNASPLASSQLAGLDALTRIAEEQAADRATQAIPEIRVIRTIPMERIPPVPAVTAESQSDGLEHLRQVAIDQARGRARSHRGRHRKPGTAQKAAAYARGAAFAAGVAALALPAVPSGAQDVHTYGRPFCGVNAWTWLETVPRMEAHDSAGSCVEAPDARKAKLTVTRAPENGSFPNISSGWALGLSGCPSAYDMRHGLCLKYPDRVAGNWDPVASVKAWLAPGYEGNLAFDTWFAAKPGNTSYQARCSSDLSKAGTEIMVWLAHPGDIAVPDTGRQYQTWIGGRRWKIDTWETFNHCPAGEGWRLVIFMAPRITDGTVAVHNLRLDPFFSYAVRSGWLREAEYLTAIDLGWEMDHGGTGNKIEGYTLRAAR